MSEPATTRVGSIRKEVVWTLAIAGAHAVVACILAAVLNIWIDECYTLDTISRTISYAWNQALHFESQPPGYFLALTLWHRIADTVFFARLFSVLCTVGTILATQRLSLQCFGDRIPSSLVPLLVAAQPLTLLAAVEARRYALVLLLTCFLLIAFSKAFLRARDFAPGWRTAYACAAVAALYVDYFIAFVLAAQTGLLFVRQRWRDLKVQVSILLLVAVACLPLMFEVTNQLRVYEELDSAGANQLASTARYVSYALENLATTQWLGSWNRPAKLLLLITLAYVLCRYTARTKGNPERTASLDPVILTTLIGLCFVALSFVSTPSILQPKHLVVMLIPWALVVAGAWTLFQRGVAVALVTGVVALNVLASVNNFSHFAKRGDFVRVARFIEQNERRGEPIVVFYAEVALGFEHHYRGVNRIVVIPNPVDFQKYDLRRFVLPNDGSFWSSLASTLQYSERIWVLTDAFSDPELGGCGFGDVDFNCRRFEEWLGLNYALERDARFFQSRVRCLSPRQRCDVSSRRHAATR